MPDIVDKVIVINRAAMRAKYPGPGLGGIEDALDRLIAADARRALNSRVIAIDDAAQMAGVGGRAVLGASDQQGAKEAVDAIYAALTPDYVMLLDGPDVIPHIVLDQISGLTDDDKDIPSDLPYACAAKYSTRAADFVAVERVVGRLPAAEGETDPDVLIGIIDTAAAHAPRPKEEHLPYFAVSAEVWTVSTQLSLKAIFQDHTNLDIAPPSVRPEMFGRLAQRTHFINCHGATLNPRFFGQKDAAYPVAMESDAVSRSATTEGTVVAAECCYGAQLYNYNISGGAQPICQAYLRNKAAAFVGATTIAYGALADMMQADLLCRFFIGGVLDGASTGRAMLQARQQFVEKQVMADPTNLKTLAQFVLLGDPSLQPVEKEIQAPKAAMAGADAEQVAEDDLRGNRKSRRIAMASFGKSVASAASLPGRSVRNGSVAVERFRELARERGFGIASAYRVTGGREFRKAMKAQGQEKRVMVAVKVVQDRAHAPEDAPFAVYEVMIGHATGDGLRVTQLASK